MARARFRCPRGVAKSLACTVFIEAAKAPKARAVKGHAKQPYPGESEKAVVYAAAAGWRCQFEGVARSATGGASTTDGRLRAQAREP